MHVRGGSGPLALRGMARADATSDQPDDTAAFKAYYSAEPDPGDEQRGVLYRLLVGWWRDRG